MKSVEETTIKINSLRQQGGSYNFKELSSLLEGCLYNKLLPRMMANHSNISGYLFIKGRIVFDIKHSINIKAVQLFVDEAKKYQVSKNKKESPLQKRQRIINQCIELFWNGNSKRTVRLLKLI